MFFSGEAKPQNSRLSVEKC